MGGPRPRYDRLGSLAFEVSSPKLRSYAFITVSASVHSRAGPHGRQNPEFCNFEFDARGHTFGSRYRLYHVPVARPAKVGCFDNHSVTSCLRLPGVSQCRL